MRNIILSILLIMLVDIKFSYAKEWYEGGTLHKATMGQFLQASHSNRLATVADMVAYVTEKTGRGRVNFTDLKRNTEDVVRCMTVGTSGIDISQDMSVSNIALSCMILLQNQNPGKYPWNIR